MRFFWNLPILVIVVLLLIALGNVFVNQESHPALLLPYSEFVDQVNRGQVRDVTVRGKTITFTLADRRSFRTHAMDDPALVDRLIAKNVNFRSEAEDDVPTLGSILMNWFPMLLLIAVWIYFMRQMKAVAKKPE